MKVIQVIPNFLLAGAETMCAALSAELNKINGVEVLVVSLYDDRTPLTQRLENSGIRVLYLGKRHGPDVRVQAKLYKLFKRERPDVVHTHLYATSYAVPAAALAGVKCCIHTVHNVAEKEARTTVRKINSMFYKSGLLVPVALSGQIKETVQEVYSLPSEKVPVIYNGVDFTKCKIKEEYNIKQKIRFVHVGRFSEQKNHETLIDAFKTVHEQLPNTEHVLVGGGELQSQIREKVKSLGLQDCVAFYGVTDDVYTVLHSADVFVLPSKYEGMPMSLIEAMGTGLPIIASNVGGIPDMIENENEGLLVEPTAEAVSSAMLCMQDAALRQRLGQEARKKALMRFSAQKMAQEYLKLYGSQLEREKNK